MKLSKISIDKIRDYFTEIDKINTIGKFNKMDRLVDLSFKQKNNLCFYLSFGSWSKTSYDMEITVYVSSANLNSEQGVLDMEKGGEVFTILNKRGDVEYNLNVQIEKIKSHLNTLKT